MDTTRCHMKNRLRAIFFDIDDTLFSTSRFAKMARNNAVKNMLAYGLKCSQTLAYENLVEVIREFSVNYNQHFQKLLSRLPERSCRGANKSILTAAAVVGYHNTKFRHLTPYPDATKLLRFLQRFRLIKGVISAGLTVKQCEKLVRLGLYKYFNHNAIFITEEIGISKPNPKLFTHVCAKLRLRPSECMYVGNSEQNDIIPSKKAGFHPVLLARREGSTASEARYVVQKFTQLARILRIDFKLN